MLEKYQALELVKNSGKQRFELAVEGFTAFIDYDDKTPHQIALLHTEVPKELEGRGVAAALVEKTFHYIENHKLTLVPFCPYVVGFLKKHPEWKRILRPSKSPDAGHCV